MGRYSHRTHRKDVMLRGLGILKLGLFSCYSLVISLAVKWLSAPQEADGNRENESSDGLKNRWPKGRVGSTPTFGTTPLKTSSIQTIAELRFDSQPRAAFRTSLNRSTLSTVFGSTRIWMWSIPRSEQARSSVAISSGDPVR